LIQLVSYLICRGCEEKIQVVRPKGSVGFDGNVNVGPGIDATGGKITFGKGGRISFGRGGKITFGAPAKQISVKCVNCGYEGIYSIDDIFDG